MPETPKLKKISRLNVTLSVLGYQVSVEGDQVHLFNPMKKYAGSLTHEDFQIWAIELTAERAVTEYILTQVKMARLETMSANQKITTKKTPPKKSATKKTPPKKSATKKTPPKKSAVKKVPRLKMPPIKKVSHRSQG